MLSPIHKERLLEVARRIEANPEKFDINNWFGNDAYDNGVSPCETTACIAGEAVLIAYERKEIDGIHLANIRPICNGKSYRRLPHWAGDYLGVPHTEKHSWTMNHPLFYLQAWVEPFRSQYEMYHRNPVKRAEIAVARIHHFIEHGE